ncbi:MAG: hypothetical protein KTR17_13060 [Cellvibrionaceae bacterium]|nr:hypothetical protein [Cellvibrionaceae bacterium]
MIRKFLLVAAAVFSPAAIASDDEHIGVGKGADKSHAVIAAYKELRKRCAASAGDKRVKCFSELKGLNAEYQSAKRLIAEQGPAGVSADNANLHVVSNVY